MNIVLKELTLHHFLSFDEAKIDLENKNFCLVSGINKCPKDAAKSNGAGKSALWNAISFALTGETLNGLRSNLSNIYFDDGCWVELKFSIDNHNYVLLRSKDDKKLGTNLKITVDGEDRSGKGIRESEAVLAEILPDLTSELIGSVMILGQGMPNKFTNNSPSRRKEILEHLSKSDFMIQDLKERVEKRNSELKNKELTINNTLVAIDSKLSVHRPQLEKLERELSQATKPETYDKAIEKINKELNDLQEQQKVLLEADNKANKEAEEAYSAFTRTSDEKQSKLDSLKSQREKYLESFNEKSNKLKVDIMTLKAEIDRLENIKDICPTCGQKIPNVIKPDTTNYHEKLSVLLKQEADLFEDKKIDDQEYQEILSKLSSTYDTAISTAKDKMDAFKRKATEAHERYLNGVNEIKFRETQITTLKSLRDNYETNINRIKKDIEEVNKLIKDLYEEDKINSKNLATLGLHLDVISKMNTFLKRDFRGYLLESIINYISLKAKEYCSKIFGSDEIKFELDGNDIDISYCGKDYANLSGGEKQRVDLIIQFAIRDMLVNYLGFSSNILVLDEITDNLDSTSCDKVLNFITSELSSIDSVFIVSHHASELAIPYDSEIIVEKNILGVSEVM